jgi:hypothetical protein
MRVDTFNSQQPVKRRNGSTAYELFQNPMGAPVSRSCKGYWPRADQSSCRVYFVRRVIPQDIKCVREPIPPDPFEIAHSKTTQRVEKLFNFDHPRLRFITNIRPYVANAPRGVSDD